MAKSREGKRMMTIEMDTGLYDAINEMSFEQGLSISSAVRMVLIDYLKRYRGYKPTKERIKDC